MPKPSEKASGRKLIPQPHGGALLPGAGGGPQPGGGRPPSAIRKTLRKSADERVKILSEIADNKEERASDRIKAVDILFKYGLGEAKGWEQDAVALLIRDLADSVMRHVTDADELAAIEADFRSAIRAHKP